MDAILQFGITTILFLQRLGAWLAGPMQALSFLGTEYFYLFAAPAIYWCWDASLGLRVGLLLMLSSGLNLVFKITFHDPRPYWVDPRVTAYSSEISFGMPSGHAQNAVALWGRLALWLKQKWAWIVAIALIFLIGLSRMYLGVHFPSDVLVGWVIGLLILWAVVVLEKPIVSWLTRRRLAVQALAAFLGSLALAGLGLLARWSVGAWTVPASWQQTAANAAPGSIPLDPLALSDLFSNAGVFFGMAAGGILMKRLGGFDAGGAWYFRLGRFLVGLIGVAVLWYGLGVIFPRGESLLPVSLRYLRYSLVGLWVTCLAPWLFLKVKLANQPHSV